MASTVLHLLQMKRLLGGQAHEDAHNYLMNFIDVWNHLNIATITQEFIYMHLFPFSITGKVITWLGELSKGSITSLTELTESFLNRYFPLSRMLQFRDEITNF